MSILVVLDYLGVACFAATGALAASRKELDVIGFVFLAAVTGIGGGTVRDLVLGVPVFWVAEPTHIVVCTVTALAVFFAAPAIESRHRWLVWTDAVALAAYGVFGAHKGYAATGSAVVAVVMGMLTGCLGGIMRDVLAREPSVLLTKDIYVTAAMAGGVAYVAAAGAGLAISGAAAAGFAIALMVRAGGIALGWSLPAYRSRPGRAPR